MTSQIRRLSVPAALAAATILVAQSALGTAMIRFDVPAQPLADSIKTLASQANTNVMFDEPLVEGRAARALRMEGTVDQALTSLLADTGLTYRFINSETLVLSAGSELTEESTSERDGSANESNEHAKDVGDDTPRSRTQDGTLSEVRIDIPEILVRGSKLLNMDLRRSRDDAQPYVVFSREVVENSGVTTLNEFFKTRLPMNSVGISSNQNATNANGSLSQVNLRGLGTNQTLILIDGRRVSSTAAIGNALGQPDLNSIPMASIERIEVLPATASGIYGGGATGGVINIVRRRDYSGIEATGTYSNSFDPNSAQRRFDLNAGFNLEGGRTNVLFSGSYSKQDALTVGDRDFAMRGMASVIKNSQDPQALNTFGLFPPLGATANVVSLAGTPLFGDGTPSFTSVPIGYTGEGGLAALQQNAGRYNFELANSAQLVGGKKLGLLNGPTLEALSLTLRREFTQNLDVFLDVAAARNIGRSPVSTALGTFILPDFAPTNPFGQTVAVTVPIVQADNTQSTDNRSGRATLGLILDLPAEWRAGLDYTRSRSRSYFSLPGSTTSDADIAIATGALDILRDPSLVDFSPYLGPSTVSGPFHATLNDAVARVAGPLFSVPGGNVTISTMIEHKTEKLDDGYQVLSPALRILFPHRSQEADSFYVETKVPFISNQNRRSAIYDLELQIAGRWDRYTTEGANGFIFNPPPDAEITRRTNTTQSTNPTIGIKYLPTRDVILRASYSTGFLPPAVNQLIPTPSSSVNTVIDPRRGAETALVAGNRVLSGGNPELQPEDSKSFSIGAVYSPASLKSFRISVDYVQIKKSDEIRTLTVQQIVDNEAILSGRVTRAPTQAGDPFGVGQIVGVDATSVNLAHTKVEAVDGSVDYSFDTVRTGTVGLFASTTWMPHYTTKLLPTSDAVERTGVTSSFPLKFRANAGVTWTKSRWSLAWNSRFYDSYLVADPTSSSSATIVRNQGSDHVASQLYHDLSGTFRLQADDSILTLPGLNGIEARFGITNIFNKLPPFDASNTSYFYSYFGDPRLRSYYLSLKASL